jgi:hypothetical protein
VEYAGATVISVSEASWRSEKRLRRRLRQRSLKFETL